MVTGLQILGNFIAVIGIKCYIIFAGKYGINFKMKITYTGELTLALTKKKDRPTYTYIFIFILETDN